MNDKKREKNLTDEEMKKLVEMGAIIRKDLNDKETDWIVQPPIGEYCPTCGKAMYFGENEDYTLVHCPTCKTNWLDPKMATDDDMELCYYIIDGALKGKYIFSKPKNEHKKIGENVEKVES